MRLKIRRGHKWGAMDTKTMLITFRMWPMYSPWRTVLVNLTQPLNSEKWSCRELKQIYRKSPIKMQWTSWWLRRIKGACSSLCIRNRSSAAFRCHSWKKLSSGLVFTMERSKIKGPYKKWRITSLTTLFTSNEWSNGIWKKTLNRLRVQNKR